MSDGKKMRKICGSDRGLADATTYIAPSALAAFCVAERVEDEDTFVFVPVENPAEVSSFLKAEKRKKRGKK